ncbi:MAG TPA: TolC family protein [Ignavibacteriaceae bacterium]|nr:TolC family protein [Ignavibacteriaceae bacterium]
MYRRVVPVIQIIIISSIKIFSQANISQDSILQNATLQNCVQYAIEHQPAVQQSVNNEKIVDQEINSKIADWFPQLNFNFTFQHNYKLQTSVFQGKTVRLGVFNTSSAQFNVSQTIFNRDVLLAASSAGDVRNQAKETTAENEINTVVSVSKAFYLTLLAEEQIELINEDITRLELSEKDTYSQYKNGVVDKTDYMRATIALNNSRAEKKHDEELLKSGIAALKELMGYPPGGELQLVYDHSQMENDIYIDTTRTVNYNDRIEYKLLQTERNLQVANLHYYEWSFIPSLSAFGAYNFNFLNDDLSLLYNQNFPGSFVGLQLNFPIFEGTKRIHEIEQANLEVDQYDFEAAAVKNSISREYTNAMADYKSNLANYLAQKENLKLAEDVYNIIQLQYKSGIKTYLDVITSETDLKETEVNYINALYQVLSSKIDVRKALGEIKY